MSMSWIPLIKIPSSMAIVIGNSSQLSLCSVTRKMLRKMAALMSNARLVLKVFSRRKKKSVIDLKSSKLIMISLAIRLL